MGLRKTIQFLLNLPPCVALLNTAYDVNPMDKALRVIFRGLRADERGPYRIDKSFFSMIKKKSPMTHQQDPPEFTEWFVEQSPGLHGLFCADYGLGYSPMFVLAESSKDHRQAVSELFQAYTVDQHPPLLAIQLPRYPEGMKGKSSIIYTLSLCISVKYAQQVQAEYLLRATIGHVGTKLEQGRVQERYFPMMTNTEYYDSVKMGDDWVFLYAAFILEAVCLKPLEQ